MYVFSSVCSLDFENIIVGKELYEVHGIIVTCPCSYTIFYPFFFWKCLIFSLGFGIKMTEEMSFFLSATYLRKLRFLFFHGSNCFGFPSRSSTSFPVKHDMRKFGFMVLFVHRGNDFASVAYCSL